MCYPLSFHFTKIHYFLISVLFCFFHPCITSTAIHCLMFSQHTHTHTLFPPWISYTFQTCISVCQSLFDFGMAKWPWGQESALALKEPSYSITSIYRAEGGIANSCWNNQHGDTRTCPSTHPGTDTHNTWVNLARKEEQEPETILPMRESMLVNIFNWKHGLEHFALLFWSQLSAWNQKYLIESQHLVVYSKVILSAKVKFNGSKKKLCQIIFSCWLNLAWAHANAISNYINWTISSCVAKTSWHSDSNVELCRPKLSLHTSG